MTLKSRTHPHLHQCVVEISTKERFFPESIPFSTDLFQPFVQVADDVLGFPLQNGVVNIQAKTMQGHLDERTKCGI